MRIRIRFGKIKYRYSGVVRGVQYNGERIICTKEYKLLCYNGNNTDQKEVGFLISKNFEHNLIEFKGILKRLELLNSG